MTKFSIRAYLLVISIFFILFGCATQKQSISEWTVTWDLISTSKSGFVVVRDANYGAIKLHTGDLENLMYVSEKMAKVSGIPVQIRINNLPGPNAYVYQQYGTNFISITVKMLNLFGLDEDALANIIGHEMAHIKLSHIEIRKERETISQVASNVVGIALEALGVPFGSTISSTGTKVITSAYSREEERESDNLGIEWAIKAGYSPCGFVKTFKKIQSIESGSIPFLASHPITAERIESAIKLAQAKGYGDCKSIFD